MEWFVAFRYLTGKRNIGFISLITWISTLGVCVGTLVLVIALSIANGFETEVRNRIVGTFAHAKIMQFHASPIADFSEMQSIIENHPNVVATAPYIYQKAGIEKDRVQEGIVVMGINAGQQATVTDLGSTMIFGELNLDSLESNRGRKQPAIILGIGLADKLGVRPGSEVVLIALSSEGAEFEPTPMMKRFVVSGVFESGMVEYDMNLTYISLKSAQQLFAYEGVEGLQVKTDDLYRSSEIAEELLNLLGGYPYRYTDWISQNKSLFKWMKLEKLVIFIVISLIMVIAAFNIISSLIMMILEKRAEIGILMSMGATSANIMKIFLYNGLFIGLVGSSVGVVLGVVATYVQHRYGLISLPGDIYFINTLPAELIAMDVVMVFFMANILCLLATLYPAWRATKILPARAISIRS